MNKLAPLFAATALALSGATFAQDTPAPPADSAAQPDGTQAQETPPKGFVLIQRNIYVPVDAEGNMATKNWVVIDKQGFITAEELEAAQRAQGAGDENENTEAPKDEGATEPSVQMRPSIGEGPMSRS